MARIRDPARDRAYTLWKEAGGEKAPKGILKEIAETLNKSESLIRKWKNNDKWEKGNVTNKSNSNVTNDNSNVTNKKELIKQAKSMVVSGNTLKETSTKLNINENTLRTYSAKEKWIEKQEKYLENLHQKTLSQYEEQYLQDTKMSITLIHNLMVETYRDKLQDNVNFQKIGLRDGMINLFTKAMKAQSSLLGIISTDKMADINLKKMQLDLEKEKFIITSELKRLEILTKSDNINTTEERKEDLDVDKNIEKWVDEVWK